MPQIGAILPIIAALGSAVGGIAPLFMNKKQSAPKVTAQAPTIPNQVAPDQTGGQLASMRKENLGDAPNFLGLSAGMTPLQKRTAIAQGALQGQSQYKDPAAVDYYKGLAANSLLDQQGGVLGSPTPIESQFVSDILGQKVRNSGSTESFLSALGRF